MNRMGNRHIVPGLILAAGLALRLYLLLASRGYVDGDEAMVGLQALEILRGRHSVFFAGELLAGSVEAYLVAPVFWLFGASPYTLRIVPLAFSLALILLNYHLARRAYDEATGLLSAAMVAVCPLLISVLSLKTWGGYIETATLGEAALLLTMAVVSQGSRGSPPYGYLAATGMLSGVAGWMHPLYFYYLFTVGTALSIYRFRRSARELCAFVVPFLVGCAPLWLGYLLQQSGPAASSVAGLVPLKDLGPTVLAALSYFVTDALPTLVGLRPIKGEMGLSWAWAAVPIYLGGIACGLWKQLVRGDEARGRDRAVLLLFLLLSPLVFVLGAITNGNYTVIIPGSGLLSRYAVPVYTVLPIFAAALIRAARRPAPWLPGLLAAVLLGINLWSNVRSDPVAAMRSPFENVPLPAQNAELVDFLRAEGIRYAYCTHWIGYRLMLDSRLDIQTSDYIEQSYGMDRLPQFTQAVEASPEAPAYILFNPHWKKAVPLEERLRELEVRFSKAEVLDYVVYYDLSRRVHPAEVRETLIWPYWTS